MTGVRNGPLIQLQTSLGANEVIGQVPAGFTWLLKTVQLRNAAGSAVTGQLTLAHPSTGIYAPVMDFDLESGAFVIWQGWTTLGPGDQVLINASEAGIQVWCSGAELPGVVPK